MTAVSFIDSLAYRYLIDEEFQTIATSAGVDWHRLPDAIESVRIVRKYLGDRAHVPHRVAYEQIKPEMRYLELCDVDLKAISSDDQVLGYDLRKQTKALAYAALAEKLKSSPDKGDQILGEFSPETSSPVKSADADVLLGQEFAEHLARVRSGIAITAIPDFPLLSEAIGGFNPGRIILIMAATGYGKTNLGVNLALRASLTMRVGFANMEMTYSDIAKRMIVIGTQSTYQDFARAEISDEAVAELSSKIAGRFVLTDGRSLSLPALEAWARLQSKLGIKILFVDYDQKLELAIDRNIPEWKSVQRAVIRLEDLAKELGFCVILFAQVNREGEVSASHRATFSAHTVLSFEDHPDHGPVIWAKKNRHGVTGAAVQVEYDSRSSVITESKLIQISSATTVRPPIKRVQLSKAKQHWSDN